MVLEHSRVGRARIVADLGTSIKGEILLLDILSQATGHILRQPGVGRWTKKLTGECAGGLCSCCVFIQGRGSMSTTFSTALLNVPSLDFSFPPPRRMSTKKGGPKAAAGKGQAPLPGSKLRAAAGECPL